MRLGENGALRLLGGTTLLFLLILGFSSSSDARDLQGRLGLGYNSEFANSHPQTVGGTPGISLKYALTRDIAMAGILGMNTASPKNSVVGLKFFKNFFLETNLNFYFFLAGALVSGNSVNGAEFLSGFGSEFFIPGIESLGLSFELGASLNNLSGSFALRTLGVSLLNAGVHFYF